MDRADARPAKQHLSAHRPGSRFLAPHRRLQQVDKNEVRELGNGCIRQFLRGAHHVQRGADARPGLGQQGQPPLGPVALGDIDADLAHPQNTAGRVGQPEGGTGPHVLAVRVRWTLAAHLEVEHRLAGVPHPAQDLLDALDVHPRCDFTDAPADEARRGDSTTALHRSVHPSVPQLAVHDDDPDRGLAEQRLKDRPIDLLLPHLPGVGGAQRPAGLALPAVHRAHA